ncbi:MAG: ATP-binding protein [Spirochaetales bacterium]|nr:ATP-binding protein [Spirochaetales bacterium]
MSIDDLEKIYKKELALFEGLLHSNNLAIIILHEDASIRALNNPSFEIFHLPKDNLEGKRLGDVFPGELGVAVENIVAECKLTQSPAALEKQPYKDEQKTVFIEIKAFPVIRQNVLLGFLISGEDITERLELERQNKEGEKFRLVGELTAGVAHEINTPVHYIQNNLKYLKSVIDELTSFLSNKNTEEFQHMKMLIEDVPDAVNQSIEGIQRISGIVRSMTNYSHPGTIKPEEFDPVTAIDDAIILSSNEWKKVAKIDFIKPDTKIMLKGYSNGITQVFVNLIINACHAIKGKYKNDLSNDGKIVIKVDFNNECLRNELKIQFSDNGTGMSEEIKDKIFEPFFTTKPIGKGTGQGLAQVYSCIVKSHKGKIAVDSVEGEGSTFIIHLPLLTGES